MKANAITILMLICSLATKANNITVSNAVLNGQNTTAKTEVINFDVSWENSWRTSTNENNYDGAWIFVKFRKQGTSDWRHCTLNAAGFTAGAGGTIRVPADGKGAFIYRSANGIGNVNFTANQLIWNYGIDGILDNETVEIRVFALEMVYIPQGTYQLGSGGTESGGFTDGSSTTPYSVISNSSITLGTTTGNLNPNLIGTASGTIPTAYPKGFNAFWIMKYEVSQEQYVDFLNHLDIARATANLPSIAYTTGTHPNLIALQPERAGGAVGYQKAANIADWSGLRPMSELEFEKACRGFNTPAVPNEYAWGNTTIVRLTTVNDPGAINESVSAPVTANANIAGVGTYNNPTRVGIFARPTASTRELSGATYYGVMNMSDNMHEISFNIINPSSKAIIESTHGDGYLNAAGNTDIANWSTNGSYGFRGGAYNNPTDAAARISSRNNANYFTVINPNAENIEFGIRMVRVAP